MTRKNLLFPGGIALLLGSVALPGVAAPAGSAASSSSQAPAPAGKATPPAKAGQVTKPTPPGKPKPTTPAVPQTQAKPVGKAKPTSTPQPAPTSRPVPTPATAVPKTPPSTVPAAPVPSRAVGFRAAPLFTASQISLTTLPNGVRSVVKAAPGTDLVSVQVWVKAGSRHEQAAENGVANLLEVAGMRSTRNFPASDDDSGGPVGALQAVGGQGGSLTSRDSTFYSALVAAPHAQLAMRVLADIALRPDLSNTALEEAKMAQQNIILRRSLDGVAMAMDLAYATAYSKHSYRRPTAGTVGSLGSLTTTRARAFHKRQYLGANISVVVVGDIAPSEAHRLVAQNFGMAPATRPVTIANPVEQPLKLQVLSRRNRVIREGVVLAWRSPAITNPVDVLALDTLLAMWREGLDATLRKALLRDGEKGANPPLVGSYDVDFLTQKDAGIFAITLADPQDKEAAVNVVLEEVKKIQNKGVTAQELKNGRELLRRQYIQQGESVAGQAGALGFYEMIGSYHFAVNYLDMCDKVSAEDLQRVARKYLATDKYVRTEVAPLPPPRQEDGASETVTAGLAPRYRAVAGPATPRGGALQ